MQQPYRKPTEHEELLFKALVSRGLDVEMHHWDGHKTIDLAILNARLFIEVDDIGHFIDSERIIRDFKRSHFSDGDDFSTFYVTNQILDRYLDEVADALVKVVSSRIHSDE